MTAPGTHLFRPAHLVAVGAVLVIGTALAVAAAPRTLERAQLMQATWSAVVAVAAVSALARARREPAAAAGWRLIGVSFAALAAAAVIAGTESWIAGRLRPFPRVGDWLQLPPLLAMGLAMLLWPLISPSRSVRLRTIVDATLFAVACFAVLWALLIWPLRALGVPGHVWTAAAAHFGVVAVLLATIVYFGIADPGRLRGPLGWILLAVVSGLVATVLIVLLSARRVYYTGHVVDIFYCSAAALFVVATVSPHPVTGWPGSRRHQPNPPLFGSWLTYSSVAVAMGIGGWSIFIEHRDDRVLLAHGFAIVALLILRQVLAVWDVRMLTNTLEAKVAERTQALEESQLALQRTARLEALGRLAGGIAHDINNLLMGIVGYAELLENSLDAKDERREDILEIRKAVDRGARLTRQLLAFARKQPSRPLVLDPFALVTDLDRLLRRLIGSDIRLVVERTGGRGCVRIDPGQLEQVIVNMAVNARDAMPVGGTLRIEVDDRELSDADAARMAGARAGPMVRLRVRDDGVGMPPEVLTRIFEPFFTTKGEHFGTGLGLATCHGIVNQAGGFVTVASATGAGTTFDVYLPRTDQAPQWLPATDGVSGPVRGTETILLAEDDAPVREVMAATLQEQGYTMLIASDGVAAVQAAERHVGPIHLFLTDMMMPGISGLEAAKRIAAVRPSLRVLLVSGYVPDHALPDDNLGGLKMAMVPKPVTPLDLSRQVRLLLDESS